MAYDKFTSIKSTCIPLPIENVDTDQIIPARFLKAIERKGFGDNLFIMKSSKSTELVKIDSKASKLPIKFNSKEINNALKLVDKDLYLQNREDVKKFLPDILGRVLARIWIDINFKENFKSNYINERSNIRYRNHRYIRK